MDHNIVHCLISCLFKLKLLLFFFPIISVGQGFGDNLFIFTMNSTQYIYYHYDFDSDKNKHLFKHDYGSITYLTPTFISNYLQYGDYLYRYGLFDDGSAVSSKSGNYLASMNSHRIVVGNPLIEDEITVLDLFDKLSSEDQEALNSCYPYTGYMIPFINLNDSLIALLDYRDCISFVHYDNFIRDSIDFYFRGDKVNQKALLTYGNYYKKIVPRFLRITKDNKLILLEDNKENNDHIEGFFSGHPILVKHADGIRWWVLLPRANMDSAAVYLTSHESIHYSHESFFPAIDPSYQKYQYTYKNYMSGENWLVSPKGNFLSTYRYINHPDYNAEILLYHFDRCSGLVDGLYTHFLTPRQYLANTKKVSYPLWTDEYTSGYIVSSIDEMVHEMYLSAEVLDLNYVHDSLYFSDFDDKIFFSNSEKQVIFKDPYKNVVLCRLNSNGDFSSSCEIINDLIIENSIFKKALIERSQRDLVVTQLPNSDLLLTYMTVYDENRYTDRELSVLKFSPNLGANPTFQKLYVRDQASGFGNNFFLELYETVPSGITSPVHYRMPPLERDCGTEEPMPSSYNLFPNPSSGLFYIDNLDVEGNYSNLEVHAFDGRLVKTQTLDPSLSYSEISIDITHLPSGLYVVLLNDVFGVTQFKGKLVKVE